MATGMIGLAVAAFTTMAGPGCPADPVLPPGLAGWVHRTAVVAAADARGAQALVVGQAADVRVQPNASLRLVPTDAKPAAADSLGGVLRFSVAQAGPYRILLGQGAWIDVLHAGHAGGAIASTGHSHGPACSTIGKMVDFALTPGDYVLQLSGAKVAMVTVMILKV